MLHAMFYSQHVFKTFSLDGRILVLCDFVELLVASVENILSENAIEKGKLETVFTWLTVSQIP